MGWFTEPKKVKFKKIPSAPEQKDARAYEVGLMNRNLQYPAQQFAGLTPDEQAVQDSLPDYFAQTNADFSNAGAYYKDILSGNYDPLSSPGYLGTKADIEKQTKKNVQGVKRSAQASGMLKSGRADALAAKQQRLGNAALDIAEAGLLDTERNRMQGAAGELPDLNNAQLDNMGNISDLAEKERSIQDMRNAATYDAAIKSILSAYTYNTKIAGNLINEPRYAGTNTGGGLNPLGEFNVVMGPLIARLIGSIWGPMGQKVGGMIGDKVAGNIANETKNSGGEYSYEYGDYGDGEYGAQQDYNAGQQFGKMYEMMR